MSDNRPQSINPFEAHQTQPTASVGGWGYTPPTQASAAQPAYDLQTTYVPHTDDVVPSVPVAPPAAPVAPNANPFALPASTSSSVPAVTPAAPQLVFTETTAPAVVSGKIGAESQQRGIGAPPPVPPAGQPGRPDDGSFGASNHDTRPLLRNESARPPEDYSKYPFYNIRKYRPYFDVDTREVVWRVVSSFIGAFKPDFMEVTHERPDLYGPFWVATTLVVVTAVSGNFSSYVSWWWNHDDVSPSPPAPPDSSAPPPSNDEKWVADMTQMAISAALFYGYIFILSIALWGWVKWLRGDLRIVHIFCVYGYSLTIFIPISLLCVLPYDPLRWSLVMLATLVSGGFLLMNMRRTLKEVPCSKSIWPLGTVAALHLGLGIGLKLYFFNY
mmetsp:Transcript_7301/g.15949  ORF Transcript_7301/g.15949 Transcript_7301/m.15949 type:complete len:386 (-) Transcript_7301:351-1508(-)